MANRRAFQYPRYQAWGSDETFLDGGTIEFFDAGTSNNRNVYQDAALTTTAPNPVTLNSRGEPQSSGGTAIDLYLDNGAYKIVLKDSSGTTIHTIDNYIETQDVLEPKDPADATDQATDVFEGQLNSDPASGETFQVDFQDANTTTTPTFENTSGSLGALTIKTRDGSALWSGALNGVHELQYDGTDYLVLDPHFGQNLSTSGTVTFRGYDPEHATDGGTDAYVSATNTTAPGNGVRITRDFQSANTTTTPTLDSKTITDRDGNALWAGAINGVHECQYASGTDTYLLLDPRPIDEDDMASDSDAAVPTQQSAKAYADNAGTTVSGEVDVTNGGNNDLTEIDFTGLDGNVNTVVRSVRVLFDVVSTSGTDNVLVQLGDSGGFETSGYTNIGEGDDGSTTLLSTSGFIVQSGAGASRLSGVIEIYLGSNNKWYCSYVIVNTGTSVEEGIYGAGVKTLSAALDRVRITLTGSNTFDNGNIDVAVGE